MTKAAMIPAMLIQTLISLLLLVGDGSPAQAQQLRIRTAATLIFFASPTGNDLDNDCLVESAPCTPQGAHIQAQKNYDYAHGGACIIKLANGTYTNPDGFMRIAGQLVGRHLCQVNGNVDNSDVCLDADAVTFDVPAGRFAFDVQDLMIVSINCVRVMGAGSGFYGRQNVIIDLANINCGEISQCFVAEQNARIKIVGFAVISGNMSCFACISDSGLVSFAFTSIIVSRTVDVAYLAKAQRHGQVEFFNAVFFNPSLVASGSQCTAFRMGTIEKNGLDLPCADMAIADGKIYP